MQTKNERKNKRVNTTCIRALLDDIPCRDPTGTILWAAVSLSARVRKVLDLQAFWTRIKLGIILAPRCKDTHTSSHLFQTTFVTIEF